MSLKPHDHKALEKLTNGFQSALALQVSEESLLRLARNGYADFQAVKVGTTWLREFKLATNSNKS